MAAEISQQRQLDEHHDWLIGHDTKIRDLELWKAEMRGSLNTITYIVAIGMGLPATIGTLYGLSVMLDK